MLLSDEIIHFVEEFELIDKEHFNKSELKAAGYRLHVGKDYAINGEVKTLEKGKNEFIQIDPFQCAILSTEERLNMPRFLIGRWNLRVSLVYKGLLWLGGPQVDPGYCGNLFCPIFNLSNSPVKLRLGGRLALIDFVRTTEFNEKECKIFKRPPNRKTIWGYEYWLESALYIERQRLIDIEKRIDKIDKKIDNFIIATMTVSSILIAVLSILVGVSDKTFSIELVSTLSVVTICISILALGISIFCRYYRK